MKEEKFKLILLSKELVLSIDNILCRFPNKEKVLKDRIKSTLYDIIELIYNANYLPLKFDERIIIQTRILSKISLIDFLLEESYRKGYLPEMVFHENTKILTELNIKIKGWISYGKNNSKRSN